MALLFELTLCAFVVTRDASATSDMRLWSFGDCERAHPSADSQAYKECMRVVASPEAKDLRAQQKCEASYENDQKGIDRCLSAYRAVKEGRISGSTITGDAAPATTGLTPETTLKVTTIAAAAAEQGGATQAEPASADAPTVQARSRLSMVLVGALGLLLMAVGGAFLLRKPD